MSSPLPLAVISGGSSGIGLAVARRLASTHRLALLYARDVARAEALRNEFPDPSLARIVRLDVGDDSAVEQGYGEICEHFGAQPEVLVNAAGIARSMQFFIQGRNLDLAQELMNINYFGALRLAKKVLPGMYRRRQGSIVNLSSVAAQGGYSGYIGYSESKAALECFTRNLAVEVGHRGVSVNCVAPGLVETRMTEGFVQQAEASRINGPLGRLLRADEVASAVLFLIQAGPAVNGQVLVMDGAFSVVREQLRVLGKA